jgi:hypothetical protein
MLPTTDDMCTAITACKGSGARGKLLECKDDTDAAPHDACSTCTQLQTIIGNADYSLCYAAVPLLSSCTPTASSGSHEQLRAALSLLQMVGELLPLHHTAVGDVVRRLRGLEPFLDFAASDPKAR